MQRFTIPVFLIPVLGDPKTVPFGSLPAPSRNEKKCGVSGRVPEDWVGKCCSILSVIFYTHLKDY